ncbi:hypothetical protein ACFLYT_00895 [Nanoarchaeota archaeon]
MEFLKNSQKDVEVAKTMVKNRLATDLNDAMKQIQERRQVEKGLIESAPVEKPVNVAVTSIGTTPSMVAKSDSERLEEIQAFLKRFDKFFSNFYNDTQAKLSSLTCDVNAMKDQITNLRLYARGSQSEHQANLDVREEKVEKKVEKTVEKKENHNPCSGNFKPGDVIIENVFSNAHGRMQKK